MNIRGNEWDRKKHDHPMGVKAMGSYTGRIVNLVVSLGLYPLATG